MPCRTEICCANSRRLSWRGGSLGIGLFPANKYTCGLVNKHGSFAVQLILYRFQQFFPSLLQNQGSIAGKGIDIVIEGLGIIHNQIIVLILTLHMGEVLCQLRRGVFQVKGPGQILKGHLDPGIKIDDKLVQLLHVCVPPSTRYSRRICRASSSFS